MIMRGILQRHAEIDARAGARPGADLERARQGLRASPQARETMAAVLRARIESDAVVLDREMQGPGLEPDLDHDLRGARVPRDVRQRLLEDEEEVSPAVGREPDPLDLRVRRSAELDAQALRLEQVERRLPHPLHEVGE